MAVLLKRAKIPFILIEKNKILGKKLLATGNGRCNIHNANTSFVNYQSTTFSKNSLSKVLDSFSFVDFEKMLKTFGLLLETKDDGRAYPLSNSAKSVLEVFLSFLEKEDFCVENEVLKITSTKNGFLLQTQKGEINADCLILACGSEASKKLGGSDKGLFLAKNLSLECIKTYPSLVPLCGKIALKNISGVKVYAKLTLKDENFSLKGDLLFSDYGITGFSVLDISSKIKKDSKISIDLLPMMESASVESLLLKGVKNYPKRSPKQILCGILNPKLAQAFVEFFNLEVLNTKTIKSLVFALKNLEFCIEDTKGFDFAEVSGGGVSAKEIDANTMECVRYKNLYIIGELLDVVGDRGGYNLAFAWASAYVCYKNLAQKFTS